MNSPTLQDDNFHDPAVAHAGCWMSESKQQGHRNDDDQKLCYLCGGPVAYGSCHHHCGTVAMRFEKQLAEQTILAEQRMKALQALLSQGGLNSNYRSTENMRVCKAVAAWISAGADVGDFAGFPTPAPLARLASDLESGHAD